MDSSTRSLDSSSTETHHDLLRRVLVSPASSSDVIPIQMPDMMDVDAQDDNEEEDDDAFDEAYRLHSQASHMGILDPSYQTFVSAQGHGALIYKIASRTLIITGDPLCPPSAYTALLSEVNTFRQSLNLKLALMNISEPFARHCRSQGHTVFRFGRERVLNPLTNKLLRAAAGKRILARNRHLLDPNRGGLSVGVYAPAVAGTVSRPLLERELQRVYDNWRRQRRDGRRAYVTQYDVFSRPKHALFLYVLGPDRQPLGLAALRSVGARAGFHLDPCLAAPGSPSGITDLLVVAAMTLLRRAGIAYLSLGCEPLPDLDDGRRGLGASLTRLGYRRVMRAVRLGGKKAYHDKFRPDDALGSDLYIAMPSVAVPVQQSLALMHVANIRLRRLFLAG
ncbi:hypothetical protein GQ602_005351 [Ophiocordyceps camponoti-floridani]|uniref:Phosphatidylglycerol lysyltransferase C-terminal domain-containing protein n=1 Tax=Ophiocordyceps camponoti-floridani TaxID=2030778 RepID=A0A8H4Q5L7_9HYPO|nr:hypothetical protein GQ602_005351 [Ophiocordyceps camponoti-floridani]